MKKAILLALALAFDEHGDEIEDALKDYAN
jgi:hypothetical protein